MNTKEDAAIQEFMRDIDLTLLGENLKLTPTQPLGKFVRFRRFTSELRRADEDKRRPIVDSKEPTL
jgi:hypothetical protein